MIPYWTTVFFALGACIGSFLNVVIWRLPHAGAEVTFKNKKGRLTLNWPPSHCPICDTGIKPWHNVPIFGWLMLRGKCASCHAPIAVRYPLVELATGLLFSSLYLAFFAGHWNPAISDLSTDWPILILYFILGACLLAASAIDADWYIIPLSIPALLAILALAASPFITNPAFPRISALADDPLIRTQLSRAALGGTLGLILANLLLKFRILPQSFSASASDSPPEKSTPPETPNKVDPLPPLTRKAPSLIASAILLLIIAALWIFSTPAIASLATLIAGILIFLIGVLPRDAGSPDVTDEVVDEITNALNPRREMLKELMFLVFPFGLATIFFLAPIPLPDSPLVDRLCGVLLGFLAGGAIVWLVRIFGTLLFNKEAMGLGDVHLMAGVGAILGTKLVILAFFAAPFLGILWAIVLLTLRKRNILPYGPWLSIASILTLIIGDPLLNWYIAAFLSAPGTPPGPV